MAGISDRIKEFMQELSTDALEERVIEFVIREVHNGRKLADVLSDPYVKNRLSEERLANVLENPDVIAALEQEIAGSFERRDFGFAE